MIKKSVWLSTLLLAILSLSWPRGVSALPPRPEPTPTLNPVSGGGIELRVWSAQTGAWDTVETIVQWQDGLGGWHDVDGWLGTLDQVFTDGGRKTWYVSPDLFGKGPFRWVVYQGQETLGVSESFSMPSAANTLVRVTMTVTPEQ